MRYAPLCLALIAAFLITSCGDRANDSTVHFHFQKRNQSLSTAALLAQEPIDSTISPLAASDGGFGLASPLSFSSFNCFGVFVDYPDVDGGSFCTDANAAVIAEPDDFFGLVSLDGGSATLSAKVKTGSDVRFHVVAFQSSGVCPVGGIGGINANQTILSPPSLVNGVGELRNIDGDNVTVNLTAAEASRKDINDCQGALFNFNTICNGSTATNHLEIPAGPGFLICTAAQLVSLADSNASDLSNTYVLGRDIDMSGVTSKMIGDNNSADFTGNFSGNGHKIINFSVSGLSGFAGLFRRLSGGAQVTNLRLVNHNVNGDGVVGGVAAAVIDSSIRDIVYESGTVSTIAATSNPTNIGGIAGELKNSSGNGTIERVIMKATVSSSATGVTDIGGIAGLVDINNAAASSLKITRAKFSGTVSGNGNVAGGIAGKVNCTSPGAANNADIFDSYSVGNVSNVTAGARVGGVVGIVIASGACNRVSVFRTYFNGQVSSTGATTEVGGLVGRLDNSAAAGDVSLRDSFFSGANTNGATKSFVVAATNGTTGATNNIHFTGSSCASCSTTGSTGSTATLTDFNFSSNAPMSAGTPWDFTNTWTEFSGGPPRLRFEAEIGN